MELGPLQKKWVAALRSGEYQQGRGMLCNQDPDGSRKYCCLGVLCKVLNLKEEVGTSGVVKFGEVYNETVLPIAVVPVVGLRSADGMAKEGQESLLYYNDECGFTFEQIADMLEANPEEWFTESK